MKIVPAAGSIRRRLFWIVGGVSLGCLLVANLVWLPGTIREIREAQEDLRRFAVRSARDQIGQFLAGKVHALTSVTSIFRGPYLDGDRDELRLLAQRFLQREPAFEEVGIVGPEGMEILRISRRLAVTGQDLRDRSDVAIFREGRRRPYWGTVEITETSEPWVTVGVPFKRSETAPAGVVYGVLNLKSLWRLTEEFKLGSEGRAYMVDGMGRLIASNDPSLVLKQMSFADRDLVKRLIGQGAGSGSAFVHDAYVNELAVGVAATGVLLEEVRWGVIVEQRQSLLYAPVRQKILFSLGLSVIGLLTSFALSHLLSRRLSAPIIRLREVAAQIGLGRLEHQVEIETSDEIGDLARQFNQMADQLRSSHQDLERRVEDATRESERRRHEAEELAHVARSLTESLDMNAVGERIATSVRDLFGVKASTLKLLRSDGLLCTLATTGEGFYVHAGGDVLPAGMGLASVAVAEGRPVWCADVLNDPRIRLTDEMRDHQLRSGNRSVITVPLRANEKILGSLSLMDQTGRVYSDREVALLQAFADQAALALENARLFEETERRAAEVSTLHEIGTKLVSTLDLSAVLEEIAGSAIQLIGAQRCAVFELDPRDQRLHARASKGMRPDQPFMPMKLGQGAAGSAAFRREPVFSPDIETQPLPMYDEVWDEAGTTLREVVERRGYRAILAVPLVSRETALGAICIYWDESHAYDEREVQLLTALAQQAAVAIENAQLYEETERRRGEAEELARIVGMLTESLDVSVVGQRIVESVLGLLAVHFSALWLLQPDGSMVSKAAAGESSTLNLVMPPGMGMPGRAVTEGRPVWSQDVLKDGVPYPENIRDLFASFGSLATLAVPLHVKGRTLGALIASDRVGRTFSDSEVSLIQAFASQAGLALEQAKLHEETERRRREAEALARVARSLTENLDVTAVGERIVGSVLSLFAVRSSVLRLLEPDGSLRAVAFEGQALPSGSGSDTLPPGTGITGRAVVEGRAVWVSDVLGESGIPLTDRMRDHLVQSENRAMIAVPLRAHDKTIGSLGLSDRTGRLFSEAEVALLQTFADQAALALENARLFEETTRRRAEAEALARTASRLTEQLDIPAVGARIAESALTLVAARRAGVWLLQPDSSLLAIASAGDGYYNLPGAVLAPGTGVAGRVVTEEKPVWSSDVMREGLLPDDVQRALNPSGDTAVLGVPLHMEGKINGALIIVDQAGRSYLDHEVVLLRTFAAQAGLALGQAKLHEETERRRREAEELAELARTMTESLDVRAVSERCAEGVRKLLRVGSSSVFRLEPDGSLVALAVSGLIEKVHQAGFVMPAGAAVVGRAASTGEPVFVADLLSDPDLPPYSIQHDVARVAGRATLAIPLRSEGKTVGVLSVVDQAGRVFEEREVSLLQTFADQAALALENARLYEETERRRREAEELARVTRALTERLEVQTVAQRIVESVRRLLNVVEGTLFRLQADGSLAAIALSDLEGDQRELGYVLSPGAGVAGRAVARGEPVWCADILHDSHVIQTEIHHALVTSGVHALLAIPLRSKGEIIGALAVGDQAGRAYTAADIALLQTFGDQAAVALENARLYEETERRRNEAEELARIVGMLTESLDVSVVGQRIVESVLRLLAVDAAALWLLQPDGSMLGVNSAGTARDRYPPGKVVMPRGTGMPGRAVSEGGPVWSGDVLSDNIPYSEELRSLFFTWGSVAALAVPFGMQGKIIGALVASDRVGRRFSDGEVALLQTFASQAGIALEQARLHEETERRRREAEELARVAQETSARLEQLYGMARESISATDIRGVVSKVLRSAADFLGCRASSLRLVDREANVLRVVADYNLDGEFGRRGDIPLGEGRVGRVAVHGTPVTIEDVALDPLYQHKEEALRAGIRSVAIVPLRVGETTVGVLSIYDGKPRRFSDEEISSLSEFANLATLAIEKNRLYEETERRRREAEELAQVARTLTESLKLEAVGTRIVEGVRWLLSVSDATLFELQADGSLLAIALSGRDLGGREAGFVLPPGGGVAGQAVARGEPVWSADILTDAELAPTDIQRQLDTAGVRAVLAVPLRSKGRIVGALGIGDQEGRAYTKADISLLQTFGDQATIALENARLFEETLRQRAEAEEFARIVGMLTESLDVSVVGQRIVESVLRLLAVDAAALWLLQPDGSMVGAASAGTARARYPSGKIVMPPGTGMPGRAVIEGGPVWSGDVLGDNIPYSEEIRKIFIERGSVGALAVPFRMQGKIIGALVASDRVGRKFTDVEVTLLQTFASQAGLAFEQARLHGETERRRREAEELALVARTLTESLDLKAVAERIVEGVRRLLDVRDATVFQLQDERSLLALAVGGGSELRKPGFILPVGTGAAGQAVANGEPVFSADILHDPKIVLAEIHQALEPLGDRSVLAVPLRSKGQIIGALSVSGQVGRLFTEAETSLLQTFGDQAALAMENARLYEETKRGRREAEELAQVARTLTESLDLQAVATRIAEGVRELLNVAEATVFQLQPDRSLLALAVGGHPGDFSEPGFVIPPGAGVSGRAVATGEPVFSANVLHDPEVVLTDVHQRLTPAPGRAVLATPLRSKRKIIGVLTVSDEVGRVFTDAEVALVRAFADQGALAMENARLYADATRRQREAESLAEVGRLISKSLDPREVQQQIVDSVRALFRFRNAVLFRLEPETEDLVAVALSGEFDRFLPELRSQVGLSNPLEAGSARREGFYTLPKGIGIGGLAVRERSVVTTENVLADPRITLTREMQRAFERQSVRSGLSAPLIVKDRIIGAISFGDVESRTFTAEEIQLVQAFANQAALALENAGLYADATRRQREAESLAEVGRLISKSLDPREVQQQIVESVRLLFHSQVSDLFQLDPESRALHMRAHSGDFGSVDVTLPLPAGVGLPGLTVIERRPVTSPDILHDRRIPFHRETRDNWARVPFRSALCMPLIVKEQVVGILSIGDQLGRVFTDEEMRLAQAFADQGALAMENARLFEETRERSKELAISYAAASTFNRPVDLKTRLDAVLDNVADYFDAQAASLRLFDEEGERLQYVATRGWPEELGNRLIGSRGFGAVAEHVVATREPLVSNDLTQDPLFREGRLPQFGFRSAIYVPIPVKEKVVGILDLLSPTPGRFDDEDKAILSSLCNQIGMALESARLQEETRRRAEEQAALNAIATAMTQSLEVKELLEIAIDKVLEVTERDRVSIRLKDPVTGAVTLAAHRGFSKEEIETLAGRTQHEIVDRVSSSGQPAVINDQRDDNRLPLLPNSRSVAWIPLKARGRGVGVLGISASWPKPFSSREVDLLQAIGNVIGVGLENVRLYEETRQRLQETSTLLAVSQATSSSLDSAEVLRLLARETCRSLGADMVGAYLADSDGSVLQPVAGYHVPKDLIQAFRDDPIPMRDHEFLAEGWENRRPVYTTDSASDPRIDQGWFGRFPHRSLLFIPMMIRDERTGGIFAVWWDKAPRFTQETLRLVEGIGRQAAIAVENARLFEESRRLVAELKAMTQELGVKNKELDTFVYTVSHDLKAPLVTLQGMAELLLEGHGSAIDEKGQHYLRRLKANAQQMERLILDLLALSRIGREGRPSSAVPLGEVMEDVLLEWGEAIKTRGITLTAHDLPTLWGVRTQIEQIISNLVGNAIKYLGEPGEPSIEVGAQDDGGPMVECYVRDNGIGIDPAYHEKVFEIFQRLKDTEVEGTGVGLAIVKKIVDGVGGRIWVESAKGQGSTFRFTWPKAKVEAV